MKTSFKRTLATMLFTLVGLCATQAQDVAMATLQHGETMTTYYGADALKSAYEAAETGDQICLSGGTFTSVDINKVVKIYGAGGFTQDIASNRYKTILSGDFSIELPEGAEGLHIEGIYNGNEVKCDGDITAMTLKKCKLKFLHFNSANTINCTISQCYIDQFTPDSHSKNLYINNSIIQFDGGNDTDAVLTIVNCVQTASYYYALTAVYKNSVIRNITTLSSTAYYNCLAYQYRSINANSIQDNVVNVSAIDWSKNLFTGYYELTDAFKTTVTGTDGTEIGIYGGSTPFSDVPSNPQVTTKEVAAQADNNGTLAVKMVVEAQE